jgi:hypothetical protein|tara:strand:- start:377 stop:793 length:417 start_codon:yes stop_codon:yes gene_type:complete
MKKIILALLFAPSLVFAESIQDYFDSNPLWSENTKDVIYLTTRCSGILQVVGQHQIVVGDQEYGPALLAMGQDLGLQSGQLALEAGVSTENIKERMIYWMKRYADDSISNTDNYNNIFFGDFGDDFQFCVSLVKAINK